MRVAIVLMHPAPYREPVIARIKEEYGYGMSVLSLFAEDFGHAGNGLGDESSPIIQSKTLYPHGIAALKACIRLCSMFALSRTFDFVVWPAYAPWWLTVPILIRLLLGKKFAVCLDTAHDAGCWRSRKVKRHIFRRARFLWVPGEASKRYLQTVYSVPSDKIVEGLYLPEFSVNNKESRKGAKPVFLMVANNLPYRKMHVLATGFGRYLANGGDGRLIFCGKRASELAGDGIETIEGMPWTELPGLYARADVYVHTGNEQFSTALLVGAMAGLPLMASRDVGACADLFEDGETEQPGILVHEWRSVDAWQEAFEQMVAKRTQWSLMGEIAKKRAAKFNVDATAAKVAELIA